MLRRAVSLLAAVLGTAPGALQAQTAPRPMTVVDLIELSSLGDADLAPDGARIAFVRSEADWERNETVQHVWWVPVAGGEAVQLTNGEKGETSPRWSPDGATLAFLAERPGREGQEIWLIGARGGEAWPLTDHPTAPADPRWSPDGRWVWFLAPDPRTDELQERLDELDDVYAYDENYEERHLWRVPVDGGAPERMTDGDGSIIGYALSRDGSRVVLHRAPSPLYDNADEADVWVLDVASGASTRLTDNDVTEAGAELSPDGRTVLFRSDSNERLETYYNDKIFLVPAQGGTPRVLMPDLPYEVTDATWSADGASIWFVANTGVRTELFRVGVSDGRWTQVTRGDHTLGSWDYAPAVDRHVFGLNTATNNGDLWVLDTGGRATPTPRQVTHVFDDLATRFALPRQEAITWTGEDGVEVEGLLFYPLEWREGQRYPLVVQTHGGPAASDKFGFGNAHNYTHKLTALGYFVFKPNYRGSTGYGDDFLRNMVGHYFDQAHLDVMAGVDHLIAEGLVDGERMAKMGWSAGGHMTNKIITVTDRFRAASSGAGAANWVSMYAQSDVRTYRTPWFGGTPWQKDAPVERYWEDSPLKDVANVTTPTLFLVGEEDARVPMPQSVEMYRGLKSNDVPTHLYVAPREGHGWQELRHRLFKANVELDWFERWVRERDYTWEEVPTPARAVSEDGQDA
ncbi:MAG: S9 family peptidase [Gemmatimonadota bacterium]